MISESDANQLPSFREMLIAFSNLFISPLVALDSVFDVGLPRWDFFSPPFPSTVSYFHAVSGDLEALRLHREQREELNLLTVRSGANQTLGPQEGCC